MDKDEMKQAMKEGLKEWLDEKYAEFGKISLKAIGAAFFVAIATFVLWSHGWKKI